jgi:glycosyltransferase involved in cell wall biosynthesis
MAKSQDQTRSRWREFHCTTEQGLIPTAERDQITEGFEPKGIDQKTADNDDTTGPLVSICIVHYNRPVFLKHAIESALEQTYRHVEIIVVDDGSNLPEAADLLRSLETADYPLPVRVIRQENRYIGAARNAGARHALGDYFIFVDDDNVLMPSAVFDCVRAARRFQADIVESRFHSIIAANRYPD